MSKELHCAAPQIGTVTNDGDSETREQGLQRRVAIVVGACDQCVD